MLAPASRCYGWHLVSNTILLVKTNLCHSDSVFYAGMLTRPTWHEAKAEAEAEARESEAEAKEIFRGRGRGQNVWDWGPVL